MGLTIIVGILGDMDEEEAEENEYHFHKCFKKIDAKLIEWTSGQSKLAVTSGLQMFGVPVAPMLTGSEQGGDPHFQARGFVHWVDQQDLGWMCFEGPAFRASGMSDVNLFQAPKLGEHSREICRDILHMEDEQIEKLVADGTLEVPRED